MPARRSDLQRALCLVLSLHVREVGQVGREGILRIVLGAHRLDGFFPAQVPKQLGHSLNGVHRDPLDHRAFGKVCVRNVDLPKPRAARLDHHRQHAVDVPHLAV